MFVSIEMSTTHRATGGKPVARNMIAIATRHNRYAMKRLLAGSIVVLAMLTLAHAVRADVAHPEGEMPTCDVPGITTPRDRSGAFEPVALTAARAESSRPAC